MLCTKELMLLVGYLTCLFILRVSVRSCLQTFVVATVFEDRLREVGCSCMLGTQPLTHKLTRFWRGRPSAQQRTPRSTCAPRLWPGTWPGKYGGWACAPARCPAEPAPGTSRPPSRRGASPAGWQWRQWARDVTALLHTTSTRGPWPWVQREHPSPVFDKCSRGEVRW